MIEPGISGHLHIANKPNAKHHRQRTLAVSSTTDDQRPNTLARCDICLHDVDRRADVFADLISRVEEGYDVIKDFVVEPWQCGSRTWQLRAHMPHEMRFFAGKPQQSNPEIL